MKPSVPMIMGTTDSEASIFLRDTRNTTVTDEQVRARIAAQFDVSDARAASLMAEYRQNPQNSTAWEVLRALASDALFRGRALQAAAALSAARQQPVYLYNFVWQEPTAGGVWGTPHAFDIPFAYGTTHLVGSAIPDSHDASAAAAARNMMSAFVAFARTGNPNNPQVPVWPRYDDISRPTMTISSTCQLVNDYRGIDRPASLPFLDQRTFQLLEGPLFQYSA